MSWQDRVAFETLVGKTLDKIERDGDEQLIFHTADESFVMRHYQDCCETVEIAEIIGDLDDLIGSPILLAEEATSEEPPEGFAHEYEPESQTWTFYKIRTLTGDVTIRWLGESNGYYSEGVDFERCAK